MSVAEQNAARSSDTARARHRLLDVRKLTKHYPITEGLLRREVARVRAVDDVTFHVDTGETLGLVGESGCGKTSTGRCLLRAIDPTSGEMVFDYGDGRVVDIAKLEGRALKDLRKDMQMVFQDPFSSLNPRWTLLDLVGEPLVAFRVAKGRELEDRVAELLRRVGLRPEYLRRYPHAFSGGERQRISIARALALNPRLVVADEPVSALDVSVRAQTLNLLEDLQQELGLTYIFISHDLSVVQHICDRVVVMYVGQVVEVADTSSLFFTPKHPYTEALLSAVPKPDPDLASSRIVLKGEVADPSNVPKGCAFHPRCPYAVDHCRQVEPKLETLGDGRQVRCHRAHELSLSGVE
ncbi:peptide ABC transporter ATP-binding protein [Devosia geojensis]|uniref:Peptide ABC transporter ATP-binding protein n=1 Tax=Devosia geojensis TaxID=443610 RepID=A0A0F5FW28_9HYPH|nr:oligopeptide/dipeptide ABC transporter ATP-binding protein [Devosia geojensis]KKB12402.1 peptide ABC transporter ATP-binding protein [Devosia geojensis]